MQSRPRRSCCSGPFAPLFPEMEASKIEHATPRHRRKEARRGLLIFFSPPLGPASFAACGLLTLLTLGSE